MSTEEMSKWRGCEAWAWATKEAMFKGHGPELEFQSQALLKDGTGIPGDEAGTLRGEVRDECHGLARGARFESGCSLFGAHKKRGARWVPLGSTGLVNAFS